MDFQKALELAKKAHKFQVDKGGADYILHPIRVAENVSGETEKIVAILHDTLEDTDLTREDLLLEGVSLATVEAIEALSRKENESYMDFIKRVKLNLLAKPVKIEDIKDNMDLSRIDCPTEEDFKRNEKYKKALEFLTN